MKKKILILLMLLIFLKMAHILLFSTWEEFYRTYSPDKQYSVFASKYFYEYLIPHFIGQSGDASGRVYLYDEVSKKVINKAKIKMIGMTTEIVWEEEIAYFKGDDYPTILNPWRLPRKIKLSKK